MKKKVMIILTVIIMVSSISHGTEVGDTSGDYYYTDIKAYLNGVRVDSWTVDGYTLIPFDELNNHGFNIEWNEELREIHASFDGQPNTKPILLRYMADPLFSSYKEKYSNWIQETNPETDAAATIHGIIQCPGTARDGIITIKFTQEISPDYINSTYIPVYLANRNVSNKFNYSYNKEDSTLELQLVEYNIGFSDGSTDYDSIRNDSNKMYSELFDIYINKGISNINGEKLSTAIRLSAYVHWNEDIDVAKLGSVAGHYYDSNVKAYINGSQIDSWKVNERIVISIEDLEYYGFKTEWNGELRGVSATYDLGSYNQVYPFRQISRPLYKNQYTEWIKQTIPEMSLGVDLQDNPVDMIENELNEITIKFNKKMLSDCMNSRYIPVYINRENVSDKFNYVFNEEQNILQLKLIDKNMDVIFGTYGSNRDEANEFNGLKGKSFDVYLLEGISTVDGEELTTSLRLTAGVLWNSEE